MKMRIGALALVTLLAACATPAPPAAVLSYAADNCRAAPDLATAIPLLPRERGPRTVRTPIDASTPCLARTGAASPYLVYALPSSAQPVDIGGAIEQARVFPPSVSTLDASGDVVRTFSPAQFLNRTDRYSVQFVPQEGERYVLVTADSSMVGTSYDAVATGVRTTSLGYTTWTSGVDQTISRSRSYHGAVLATLFTAP